MTSRGNLLFYYINIILAFHDCLSAGDEEHEKNDYWHAGLRGQEGDGCGDSEGERVEMVMMMNSYYARV